MKSSFRKKKKVLREVEQHLHVTLKPSADAATGNSGVCGCLATSATRVMGGGGPSGGDRRRP